MDTLFSWLAAGFGTLFVAAVAAAWIEHLARTARPEPAPAPAAPRAVTVDVSLDDLAPPPPGDTAARQQTLDSALGRSTQPGAAAAAAAAAASRAWIETRPMVQPGDVAVARARVGAPQHDPDLEAAPSQHH